MDDELREEQDDSLARLLPGGGGYTPPAGKTDWQVKQDRMVDLFRMPQPDDADIYANDLVEPPEEPNVDDLTDTSGMNWTPPEVDVSDLVEGPQPTDKDMDLTEALAPYEPEGERQPHWSDADLRQRPTLRKRVVLPSRRPIYRGPEVGGMQ